MATTNVILSPTWEKVVDAGFNFILTLTTPNFNYVELAVSDTEVVPTVHGHQFKGPDEGLTRQLVGPGYIYARSLSNTPATAILTIWAPT